MYFSYYKLNKEPFSISTDPNFLWLGEKHKEALAALRYGVLANKGFLLLTGDVGTGKTTLINALLSGLGKDVIAAKIHDPGLDKLDFLNYIARAFGIKKQFKSKGEFLYYFTYFLTLAHQKNKKLLLIVDEAQHLNYELLEEIRLLSNIEKKETKLINIFFVGQPEFIEILVKEHNRALRQRIALRHDLQPLTEQETREYIRHRLWVAGSANSLFTAGAIAEIYRFSGGYPRLINIICDHALLTGFAKEKQTIDGKTVRECAAELSVTVDNNNRKEISSSLKSHPSARVGYSWRKLPFAARFFAVLAILTAAGVFYFFSGDRTIGSVENYWGKLTHALGVIETEKSERTVEEKPLKSRTEADAVPQSKNFEAAKQ